MIYKYRLREVRGDAPLMNDIMNGYIDYKSMKDLFHMMYYEYRLWKANPTYKAHVFYAEEYDELAKEWLYIGQVGRENGLVFLFLHSHTGGHVKLI